MPIADRAAFEANAFPDYADVAAVNLLSTVVKASEILNALADDFKVFNYGSGRGMMEGGEFDPSEMMYMQDDEEGMGAGMHQQMKQMAKGAGLFSRFK